MEENKTIIRIDEKIYFSSIHEIIISRKFLVFEVSFCIKKREFDLPCRPLMSYFWPLGSA